MVTRHVMRNLVKRVSVMKIEGLPVIDVATWSTSFAARVRRTSRAHFQPFARYSPEAFSIIGFRPASIIFGFSGLLMM